MSELNQSDIENIIREYLPQIAHMSLATCVGNKPWVCEVHFAVDNDLNIYFRSLPTRRHSQEIANNPNVAGNIVTQHEVGMAVRGVYFEGTAEQLSDVDETHPAYIAYCERLGMGPAILEDAKQPEGHKFYKIAVSSFYVFDSRESKPSQKYQLRWKA